MKLLAICGSPRKGNTYAVLRAIPEYCPDSEYKLLMLNDMHLEPCRGCYSCILRGEHTCPVKDDRDVIIDEIMNADGVIFASPVYCLQVSAVMKSFIERFGFFAHRPQFYEKFAMVMASCSGYGGEEANSYMSSMFSAFGFNVLTSLIHDCRPGIKAEECRTRNREKLTKAFAEFAAGVRKGERITPSLDILVPFTLFKMISMLEKDVMTADYEYYKDKGSFSYETRIPFYKKYIATNVAKKILKGSV